MIESKNGAVAKCGGIQKPPGAMAPIFIVLGEKVRNTLSFLTNKGLCTSAAFAKFGLIPTEYEQLRYRFLRTSNRQAAQSRYEL